MGEISKMMLDGIMCAGCGVYLEGEYAGFPRYCSKQCAADCTGKARSSLSKLSGGV